MLHVGPQTSDTREKDMVDESFLASSNAANCGLSTYECLAIESALAKLLFNVKFFPGMRHVVSAYVSRSRCGSTAEAYLGAIGELSS